MERRGFFAAAFTTIAGLLTGRAVEDAAVRPMPAVCEKLRPVWRLEESGWVTVRFYQLKPGDVFRMGDPDEMDGDRPLASVKFQVDSPPKIDPVRKVWEITAREVE